MGDLTYLLLRPSDLTWLNITAIGFTEAGTDSGTNLVPAGLQSRLIVEFPAQHIAETVPAVGSASSDARLAGGFTLGETQRSTCQLQFQPNGNSIPLSINGILSAMNSLALSGSQQPQTPGDSTLEIPWRVQQGLDQDARCVHRDPNIPAGSVTELWHTRIVRRTDDSAYATLYPLATTVAPGEQSFAGQTPLGMVQGFQSIQQQIDNQRSAGQPAAPISVDQLILSGCGAWLSGSISWPPPPQPPQLQWAHRTAMARDFYVRVLKSGVLFPFGHKASFVEIFERQFSTDTPPVAAIQSTTSSLMITEPTRDNYDFAQRQFPFQRIDLGPLLVTDLDLPADTTQPWWPMRNGSPLMFSVRAHVAQQVIPMQLPLLFSPPGFDPNQLTAIYENCPSATSGAAAAGRPTADSASSLTSEAASGPPTADVRRLMPLLMKSPTEAFDNAIQQVQSLTFGGIAAAADTGFHPVVTTMKVGLPAVRQLMGQDVPVPANWSSELLDPNNTPDSVDTLLQFQQTTVLKFAGTDPPGAAEAALRTGVVAAPNMMVNQLSRCMGPVAAKIPTDPAAIFDGSATLLGIIPLIQLIQPALPGQVLGQPTITWSGGPNPVATLNWEETHLNPIGPFTPITPSKVQLAVTAKTTTTAGPPTVITDGKISNFALTIPGGSEPLLELTFTEFTFHAETGALPSTAFTISDAKFTGNLAFIEELQQYLPNVGNGAPAVHVDNPPTQITVTFIYAVPTPLTVAVFTLKNLLLKAVITVSLVNEPVLVEFWFASRGQPFLVAVSFFGGGGYLELAIGAGGPDGGLQRFAGSLEFGACAAMDFGVASGEVHVFGGVVFAKQSAGIQITGFLRIGGRVQVLGLIAVAVELTMALTCTPTEVSGSAKLVITVDLTFCSKSVELECHTTFSRSALGVAARPMAPDAVAGPGWSVQQALGPDPANPASYPWQAYCQAFA